VAQERNDDDLKQTKSLLRGACSICRGKRTSVPGVGKRVIGAEPDTRTLVNATGMMQTTPVYAHKTTNHH